MRLHKLFEGYTVLPSIDRERYQERDGLEGPFRAANGKVYYYDAKEGKPYDPDTDMYIDYDEFQQMDKHRDWNESADTDSTNDVDGATGPDYTDPHGRFVIVSDGNKFYSIGIGEYSKQIPLTNRGYKSVDDAIEDAEEMLPESVVESSANEFHIEVSVRDARKALEMLDDQFRGQYDHNGSNHYIFDDQEVAYAVLDMFQQYDIEVVDYAPAILDEGGESLEEAVTPGDLKAQIEGKKAAKAGEKYSDNPYEKGSSRHLQWSKGHNAARARLKEESTIDAVGIELLDAQAGDEVEIYAGKDKWIGGIVKGFKDGKWLVKANNGKLYGLKPSHEARFPADMTPHGSLDSQMGDPMSSLNQLSAIKQESSDYCDQYADDHSYNESELTEKMSDDEKKTARSLMRLGDEPRLAVKTAKSKGKKDDGKHDSYRKAYESSEVSRLRQLAGLGESQIQEGKVDYSAIRDKMDAVYKKHGAVKMKYRWDLDGIKDYDAFSAELDALQKAERDRQSAEFRKNGSQPDDEGRARGYGSGRYQGD